MGRLLVDRRKFVSLAIAAMCATQASAQSNRSPFREPFLTDAWLQDLTERFGRRPDSARRRILFVGNSITLDHDIPGRVAALARADGIELDVAMAAASGARLRESANIKRLAQLLHDGAWDILVLQDYTTTPFRSLDRDASLTTMRELAAISQARRVVLYPPWPRAPEHEFYASPKDNFDVRPTSPEAFAGATMEFYQGVAQSSGFEVAPVPEAWLDAVAKGEPVYAADAYHASETGAALAAEVLWDRLRSVLSDIG